ncbi:MAG: TolC family protein [Acidobacteriaceae bacterium]|nr:TolC family protein [Acidobacteriaceae bacterium]
MCVGCVASPGIVLAQAPTPAVEQAFTLDQALQFALDHYPSVRAALEQVTASSANVSVAQAAYLPRLDSLWQTNRATANNIFGQLLPQSVIPALSGPVLPSASGDSVWGSAAGALFSWEPVDLGLRASVVKEAQADVTRARAAEGLTRLGVQSVVGSVFLDVVSAQRALAATDADVQRRDVLARAVHTLVDNQLRPGADASRADAELAAARTRSIQAHQRLIVAQATLGQVLGLADGLVTVDATRLLDRAPEETNFQATRVTEHPLAQVGQAAVDLAHAHEEVLTNTDRPRLYVQSSLFARGSGANPTGPFEGGASGLGLDRVNWAAGVQVVFPNLFDVTSLRARRAASEAQTREESARYDESVLTITRERRVADAMVDAARAIAKNMPVQLDSARQSETQARARYEAGLASIVEVADSQSLLANAEYQDAVARVEVWRALLAHAVAQGTLAPFVQMLGASGVR